jgi:DNA-binding response OmpR family regulator
MATVLVGENVADIRWALDHLFTRAGHQVSTTFSGEETLSAALRAPPDLLILNPSLPGVEGLEVCRRLRANPETVHLPIIMLSVWHEEAEVEAALAVGADEYLGKPFNNADLLARATALLERPRPAAQAGPDSS